MTEKKTRSREGWTRVRFGDVVRLVRDRVDPTTAGLSRFVAGEHMDTDDLRIRRWGNVGDGYLGPAFHMRFKPGHVLYGSRRTYLRKVALADFEGICANTTYVLESTDPSTLLPELLPFIMQTEAFHEHSIKQAKGSVNPYVNFSDLAWYEFDLPPVEEQRRIGVAARSALIAKEATRALFASARIVHGSLRQSSFGVIDGKPSLDSTTRQLGEAVVFSNNVRVPLSSTQRQDRKGPYPYYGASGIIDFIDGWLFDEERLLISEDGANLQARSTPIAFLATGKYWVNNHSHVVQAKAPWTNYLLSEYLESIEISGYVSGTAQPKLTRAACESIPIPRISELEARTLEAELRATMRAADTANIRYSRLVSPSHFLAHGGP